MTFGQAQGLQPMISVASYMDFVIKFTLAFGVVFELPVVITLLFMLGIVTPQFLSRNRKYAILINFIIAAILTPTPDMVNQTLMAGPLCILYELGIIAARIFDRKQPKPAAAPAAPAARAGAAFVPERDVMRGSLRGYVVRKPFHREGWAVLAVVGRRG